MSFEGIIKLDAASVGKKLEQSLPYLSETAFGIKHMPLGFFGIIRSCCEILPIKGFYEFKILL